MATVEDVTVQIDADVSRLTRDVNSAATSMDRLERDVRDAEKNLDRFEKTAKTATRTAASLSTTTGKASKNMAGVSKSAGQAGIQLQQFVGQVQGGVSPMVALSQQAADLGIVLGVPLIGAVVGITAAIAGPFIASLFNSSNALDDAKESARELGQSYDDLVEDVGNLTEAQRKFIALQAQNEIAKQKESIAALEKELIKANGAVHLFEKGVKAAYVGFGKNVDEARLSQAELQASIDTLNTSIKENEKRYKLATGEIVVATEEQQRLRDEVERQEESIRRSIERMEAQTVATEKGRAAAIRYSAAVQASKLENKQLAEQLIAAAEAQASAIEAEEKRREEMKITNKEIKVAQKDHKKYTDTISDGITQAIADYKDFGSAVTSVLNDIASQMIKKNISDPLSGAIGSFDFGSLFSSGPGFDLSGMDFFARGGIVNSPSVVGTSGAGNLAIAGEAGPEAVLPLARTSGGDLGVQVAGGAPMSGGSNVTVNVINQSGAEVETSESSGPSGERIINVTVLKAMKSAFANGALDRDLRTNFGVTRQGT